MKKISINAKEFVKDIRAGETDQRLMEKYGLSPKSLVQVKQELLARKFIKAEDLQNQAQIPSSGEKVAFAKRFVSDFRKKPDDVFLMQKYSLGPQQLKEVYANLVSEGSLSEYEYHCREIKALEVEAAAWSGPTTIVTIVEKIEVPGSQGGVIDEQGLSPNSTKDPRGPKIGNLASSMNPVPAIQESEKSAGCRNRFSDISSSEETLAGGFCPNCGVRRTWYSEDSCQACGIVYSKYESYRASRNVAIWKTDRAEP